MTLVETKCKQLVEDFSIFVADEKTTEFFAKKAALIHLNKLKKAFDYHGIKNELIDEQIKFLS